VFINRVITGAILVASSILASGLVVDNALAQYEPVGKPLQLVPPSYSSKSAATPRSRVAAKKAAKSEARPEAKSASRSEAKAESKAESKAATKQHVSFRRKHPQRTQVAEQKPLPHPAAAPSGETAAGHAAAAAPPPVVTPAAALAPTAMAAAAPSPQPQPAPTPVQPTAGELVVGGQAVQVRSPDEANELDLAAANAPSSPPGAPAAAPASAPTAASASAPLYNLVSAIPAASPAPPAAGEAPPAGINAPLAASVPASTATIPASPPATAVAAAAPAGNSAPAGEANSAKAENPQPKSPVGSASWIMQIMAALGGAVAAGSAAWFLIGSASPRIKLSEWQEADEEI
jgi:hypothetical protein